MGDVADRLTSLLSSETRYDIPWDELRDAQVAALNERFQERRDTIRLVRHRAEEAGIDKVTAVEDVVPLLLPHTAYKSYPESFLTSERWDRMGKWLDTVSTYRVPPQDPTEIDGIDDWLHQLQASGHYVSCTSGTTGNPAMLPASAKDMAWCEIEAGTTFFCGTGGKQPTNDRRLMGASGLTVTTPRNIANGKSYAAALMDPNLQPLPSSTAAAASPAPTIGAITAMVTLRSAIANGTASPADVQHFEEVSAERQRTLDESSLEKARALVEARGDKLHISGFWAGLYQTAMVVREMGYSAKDFNPDNSLFVAGGLKRAVLPPNYREVVYETFNIKRENDYQIYGMQELHSGMPRCFAGGRYHISPWVVPLILDRPGENLLPVQPGGYEGRAAFFDLSIDGRWGGVISGDRISIEFGPCPCGMKGPTLADTIERYADLEGDDKISCAGTIDAYVRGVA